MRTHPLSLPWARRIQPTPFQPISLTYILILYHLRQCLSSYLFPSGCPTKTLYAPLLPLKRSSCPAHFIFLDLITQIIFGEQYRSWSSSLFSLLHSPVTSPKYLSQHPVREFPKPIWTRILATLFRVMPCYKLHQLWLQCVYSLIHCTCYAFVSAQFGTVFCAVVTWLVTLSYGILRKRFSLINSGNERCVMRAISLTWRVEQCVFTIRLSRFHIMSMAV